MRWGCALYAFFVLLTHVSAHAYERDVHYDLTKYLARWAGFSDSEAEQIATADQELDTKPEFNPLPNQITCLKPLELAGVVAALLTIPKACKNDPEFQRMLTAQRAYHFADGKTLQELRDSAFGGKNLKILGHYLHALQDTFAHSLMDYTDLPPLDKLVVSLGRLPDEKVIGHLLYGHSVDKTYERPDLAEFMAQYVYAEFVRFKGSANRWNDVDPAVARFVREKDSQKQLRYLFALPPPKPAQATPQPEDSVSIGGAANIITQGRTEQRDVRYPNGQLKERGQVQQDREGNFRKVGKWIVWYENGQKAAEGMFLNGKGDGPWTFWHANGQMSREGVYRGAKKEGLWTTWFPDGKKRSEDEYRDDKEEGRSIRWSETGVRQEGVYRGAKKEGLWTKWFPDGKKWEEGEYRGDKKEGSRTTWHENGQKANEGVYRKGSSIGEWTYWHDTGNVAAQGSCRDGRPIGEWTVDGKKEGENSWWALLQSEGSGPGKVCR